MIQLFINGQPVSVIEGTSVSSTNKSEFTQIN